MLCTDIIKSKISGSSSGGGGGISGGHTVTFKTEDGTYAIASVLDGQSISAPIPNPESESGTFDGWLDGTNKVTFPYTPTEDVEFNAEFLSVRSGMATDVAGTNLSTGGGTKTNNGLLIYGYAKESKYGDYYCITVGKSVDDIKSSNQLGNGSFTYNNETWYYGRGRYNTEANQKNGNLSEYFYAGAYYDTTTANFITVATKILDHYFMKD